MFNPSLYKNNKEPRRLPVFFLIDVSGSMSGTPIDTVNKALAIMIEDLKNAHLDVKIAITIITFGSTIETVCTHADVATLELKPLTASGMTPLGGALKEAKRIVEDKNLTTSRMYRPNVVLMSDGEPNDSWQEPLRKFIGEGRSQKCYRIAMAIGNNADRDMLNLFREGMQDKLFEAKDAKGILEFFHMVSLSVQMRSKSVNPNDYIPIVSQPIVGDSDDGDEVV